MGGEDPRWPGAYFAQEYRLSEMPRQLTCMDRNCAARHRNSLEILSNEDKAELKSMRRFLRYWVSRAAEPRVKRPQRRKALKYVYNLMEDIFRFEHPGADHYEVWLDEDDPEWSRPHMLNWSVEEHLVGVPYSNTLKGPGAGG